MDDVRLVKSIWVIEHVGGVIYERFAEKLDNQDIAGTFNRFAGHEHQHAVWYGEWLTARGHTVPTPGAYDALVIPGVRFWLAPQSLERKLKTFAATERTAARHLAVLASKVHDPELKAIIERTLPYEHMHSEWYGKEGRRMLHPGEGASTSLNLE
jgi:rubrerythrin